MKYTFLVAAIAAMSFKATAQEDEISVQPTPAKERTKEVGVMAQIGMGSSYSPNTTLAGIQYKKWVSPHLGYRLLAAYGDYDNSNTSPFQLGVSSDTMFSKRTRTHISYGYVGGGIEAQRHFYKKVYLYAALEMRIGYGSGLIDTLKEKQYRDVSSSYYITNYEMTGTSSSISSFNMAFAPSIGAKLRFKRLVIGAELIPGIISYQTFKYENGPKNSSTDFNMGDISQRFYIHYRF